MPQNPNKSDTKTATERRNAERRAVERRSGDERRQQDESVAKEQRDGEDRRKNEPEGERRKVERRINEYVLSSEVLEFINAVNDFKSRHQKPFPTWSEIFEIFTALGYRKGE